MRCQYNRDCNCSRCRAHGFTGPAVLITLGVLFLIDQMGHAHWMSFSFTWPALLIVIGLVKLLEHGASPAGHIPRPYPGMPMNPGPPMAPGTPGYVPPTVVTPVPAQPAGFITPGPNPMPPPDDRGGA